MNLILSITGIFIIFGILGWLFEYTVRCIHDGCSIKPHVISFLNNVYFIPLYGFVAVGLYLLTPYLVKFSLITQFILLFIGISVVEYIVGKTFEKMYNREMWHYEDFISFKYISITVSSVWAILGVGVVQLFNYLMKRGYLYEL